MQRGVVPPPTAFKMIPKDVFNNVLLPKLSIEALVNLRETCHYFSQTLIEFIDQAVKLIHF